MSATARAEARRKAILSRGTDRLSKLTTTARGEDAPAYLSAGIPPRATAASFVGEKPSMPSQPPLRSFGDAGIGGAAPDPTVWSEEHQRQFLQALMSGTANSPQFPQPQISAAASNSTTTPPGDPFAAIMNSLQQMDPSLEVFAIAAHPVHMAYSCLFILFKEPQTLVERSGGFSETFWKRWAELAWRGSSIEGWGVQFVPFMWTFMTVQVILHSIRISTGNNQVQPPVLLALALPHLPPPFPSIITNGLRYIRMGSAILDDLSAVVFGIGMVVLIAGWFAG
ncbi:uncharacterized protein EDB93DRAFT_1254464 [Suillus bovinus]|uniref:uncharacterized protein n=1 Tax=Suillus bovinus TaxID=48563 RepID=UPI001B885C59|nr:uncharacterized protein EDB93DRAFT_1254464 [Suillus bovinus]KAG2134575.1 hypothetical protein EDB93DRAFT_1254464 [Suillus bovinus]